MTDFKLTAEEREFPVTLKARAFNESQHPRADNGRFGSGADNKPKLSAEHIAAANEAMAIANKIPLKDSHISTRRAVGFSESALLWTNHAHAGTVKTYHQDAAKAHRNAARHADKNGNNKISKLHIQAALAHDRAAATA